MTKMRIDYRALDANVIVNINSSIDAINNIIYNAGDLIIPNNFVYATYLKNLPNDILNLKTNLISKRDLIKKNIDGYKEIENNNLNEFSSIKIFALPLRKK